MRESLDGLTSQQLVRRCVRLYESHYTGTDAAVRHTLRLLAKRIQHLSEEIDDLTGRITLAVEECAPGMLQIHCVGPDSAAALLIAAGANPDRLATEASFAALCGTNPTEVARSGASTTPELVASSGQTQDPTRSHPRLKRYVAREIVLHIQTANIPALRATATLR